MWNQKRHSVIGLDLGERRVKAAQLSFGNDGASLTAWADFARPAAAQATPDTAEMQAIVQTLRQRGLTGRSVAVATPPDFVRRELLELPVAQPGVPLLQIARLELAQRQSLTPDAFEMSGWELKHTSRSGRSALVQTVACLSEPACALVDVLERAGLHVVHMSVADLASCHALRAILLRAPALTAVLDIGHRAVRMAVVRGQEVVYQRDLEAWGSETIVEELAASESISESDCRALLRRKTGDAQIPVAAGGSQALRNFDETVKRTVDRRAKALAEHMRDGLAYATQLFAEGSVDRVLLTGGGAALPTMDESLSLALRVDVIRVRPDMLRLRWNATDQPNDLGALTAAIGLCQSERAEKEAA